MCILNLVLMVGIGIFLLYDYIQSKNRRAKESVDLEWLKKRDPLKVSAIQTMIDEYDTIGDFEYKYHTHLDWAAGGRYYNIYFTFTNT